MIASTIFSLSHFNTAGWRGRTARIGKHPALASAPTCGEPPQSAMSKPVTSCETDKPTIVALTGKQKVALMLEKGGYSHAEIASKMGLKHRQTATQLITRARRAEKAFKDAVVDFVGAP